MHECYTGQVAARRPGGINSRQPTESIESLGFVESLGSIGLRNLSRDGLNRLNEPNRPNRLNGPDRFEADESPLVIKWMSAEWSPHATEVVALKVGDKEIVQPRSAKRTVRREGQPGARRIVDQHFPVAVGIHAD